VCGSASPTGLSPASSASCCGIAVDGQAVDAAEVNALLAELTGEHVTAKDFRTWSGTLAAFCYLREQVDSGRAPERVTVSAIDQAAEVLGNTRTVARAHYVHPHMLEAFTNKRFDEYLDACTTHRSDFMDGDECALLAFLHVPGARIRSAHLIIASSVLFNALGWAG